jgi:hypothetical protein
VPACPTWRPGRLALESDAIEVIQMPFNIRFRALEAILHEAAKRNRRVWTNRPFAMGQLIHEDNVPKMEAYRFVVALGFHGVVLTGTTRTDHLLDDLEAFKQALKGAAELGRIGVTEKWSWTGRDGSASQFGQGDGGAQCGCAADRRRLLRQPEPQDCRRTGSSDASPAASDRENGFGGARGEDGKAAESATRRGKNKDWKP